MKWEIKQIYNDMFLTQKGRCKICNIHQSDLKRKLALDHCHKTEMMRGLLCGKCNTGLGMFDDSETNLLNAVIYLRQANGIRTDDIENLL